MSDSTKPKVEIILWQAGDKPVQAVTSLMLRETFSDPLGEIDFEVQPTENGANDALNSLKKGEIFSVLIDGTPQATGIIQDTRISVGKTGGLGIRCSGQSLLCLPYEGHIDPWFAQTSQADVSIVSLVTTLFAPFGAPFNRWQDDSTILADEVDDIVAKVGFTTNKASSKNGLIKIVHSNLKFRDCHAMESDTAYQLAARVCNKYGVVIRPSVNGDILLTRPHYEGNALARIVQTPYPSSKSDNFLGDIEVIDSNHDQYSQVFVRGSSKDEKGASLTRPPKSTLTAEQINSTRPQYKSRYATYKPIYLLQKSARDEIRCKNAAQLAMGLKAINAFQVRGEVAGFRSLSGSGFWTVDTLVDVEVAKIGFAETMWIHERTFTLDRNGGAKTKLVLLPKGAFVVGDQV